MFHDLWNDQIIYFNLTLRGKGMKCLRIKQKRMLMPGLSYWNLNPFMQNFCDPLGGGRISE